MPEAVYRVVTLLCAVVKTVPIGTNLGLVEVLWMSAQRAPGGRLLATRGALIPGLAETGLPAPTPAGRPCGAARSPGGGRWGSGVRRGGHAGSRNPRLCRAVGYPPAGGELYRPAGDPTALQRARASPATPADQITSWEEEDRQIRAEQWTNLVLPDAATSAPTFSVIAIFDPKYHDPLLLATHGQPAAAGALSPRATRDLYRDRWPVEQLHGRFASARPSR